MIQIDYTAGYHNKNQDEIQSTYFGHQTLSNFTACNYFRPAPDMRKVWIIVVSEANDHWRTASVACISKVIDSVKKKMPLLTSLHCIFIWSDGCSAIFHSRFTFVLLTYLHTDNNIQWKYNEANHCKGPTIKNKIIQEVKSARIVIVSPKNVSIHPSRLIQSITMLYLPKKGIIKEPAGIENAPYIKDTLDVHKVKRKINDQGKTSLEF